MHINIMSIIFPSEIWWSSKQHEIKVQIHQNCTVLELLYLVAIHVLLTYIVILSAMEKYDNLIINRNPFSQYILQLYDLL